MLAMFPYCLGNGRFPVPGRLPRPFAVVVDFSVTIVMAFSLELFAVVI